MAPVTATYGQGKEAWRGADSTAAGKKNGSFDETPKNVKVATSRLGSTFSSAAMTQGILRFQRAETGDINALMGKGFRSPLTGEIELLGVYHFPDISVVDLWSRHRLSGRVEDFMGDRYLFHVVPLHYRTWFSHFAYQQKEVSNSVDEVAGFKQVLERRCIDGPVRAGRWSPVMAYSAVSLCLSLTGDIFIVLPGIVIVVVLFMISKYTNNPTWYRYERLISLPIRLVYMMVVLTWISAGGLAVLGVLLAFMCALYDAIAGDGAMLWYYGLNCSYEILKVLPNRCLVCRRHGAANYEDTFGDRGQVDECISGKAEWDRSLALIADIRGLLVELRPLREEDWMTLYETYHSTFETPSFFGLDTYSPRMPSPEAVDANDEELQRLVEKNAHKRLMNGDTDDLQFQDA